ncbi:hypothetical protein CLV84_1086 [Neolewinella xylanilytica]|uniref:Lipocalin-like protein n=1 Tax=Neolewinella xylanilytica TaxID=1514080 RepID=A0A2S6I9G9_9BACT|nr:hypothetical protein [Neolewinella xylanilytica]PPK88122.1 hypothetical protein CLV84_1086 [Neolewinella xylanilytica]
MKYLTPPVLFFFLLFWSACGGTEHEPATAADDRNLAERLPGTWETVELEVDYATYMGADTAYQEHIREADWGQVYGVRPPSTEFTPNGKLRRTYRLRSGEVANITNGIWKVTGDSLLVIEPNITYTYAYELENDRLELTGRVDQDQDGQADDDFRAVYRMTSRTR